jgi:hypothetical protein
MYLVVRADYDDRVYCKLALEAQDIFESDPLWKPFFCSNPELVAIKIKSAAEDAGRQKVPTVS